MIKKDSVTKAKKRIQSLLRQIVSIRDNGCYLQGKVQFNCGGPLTADHIMSRSFSNTYAVLDNLVCLCLCHHFYWKPQNPTIYTSLIIEKIGAEKLKELEKLAHRPGHFVLRDWQRIEEELKAVLKSLSTPQ